LLYSTKSEACLINSEYTQYVIPRHHPRLALFSSFTPSARADEFDRIIDIFGTKKKSAARESSVLIRCFVLTCLAGLIESQFTNVNKTYTSYNSKLLNQSYLAVMDVVNGSNSANQPPFLMAALHAFNSTSSPNGNTTAHDPNSNTSNDNNRPNTGLAMYVAIVLLPFIILLIQVRLGLCSMRSPVASRFCFVWSF
jgi:hypothetical protein